MRVRALPPLVPSRVCPGRLTFLLFLVTRRRETFLRLCAKDPGIRYQFVNGEASAEESVLGLRDAVAGLRLQASSTVS